MSGITQVQVRYVPKKVRLRRSYKKLDSGTQHPHVSILDATHATHYDAMKDGPCIGRAVCDCELWFSIVSLAPF